MPNEGPCHADAVLVLREAVVAPRRRKIASGQQVVLIGCENHAMAQGLLVEALPLHDGVEHPLGLTERVGAHLRLFGVATEPERHGTHAGQPA